MLNIFSFTIILGLIVNIQSQFLIDPKRNRIIGGTDALLENERHFVSLRYRLHELQNGFGAGHMCGGALLRDRIVLTAAHCLHYETFEGDVLPMNAWQIQAVMGTSEKNIKQINTIVRSVSRLIIHMEYNDYNHKNDIGLLLLMNSVSNNPDIAPISLISYPEPIDAECKVSGFGRTQNDGEMSSKLMTANVTIIDNQICNGSQSYAGAILDGMMCAGLMSGERDSCLGDSGGPLICNGKVAAIVSWGFKCGRKNYPGVYTDVLYYNQWIIDNANLLLPDTSTTVIDESSTISTLSTTQSSDDDDDPESTSEGSSNASSTSTSPGTSTPNTSESSSTLSSSTSTEAGSTTRPTLPPLPTTAVPTSTSTETSSSTTSTLTSTRNPTTNTTISEGLTIRPLESSGNTLLFRTFIVNVLMVSFVPVILSKIRTL